MTGLGTLGIEAGAERVRAELGTVDFGEPAGAEVLVYFDAPETATLHVYAREIADGALTCSLGARRAAVSMDLRLAARIVQEGIARGLTLPRDEARALRAALASMA